MYLITKWFGTFLYEKGKLKKKILFPKDKKEISKRLLKINKNEILIEEKKLSKDFDIIVNEKRLKKIGKYSPKDIFFKKIEIKPEDYDFKINLLNKATLNITEKIVAEQLSSEDLQIIQMVNALDDLIQTSNLLSERLECWSVLPKSKDNIAPLENTYSVVNSDVDLLIKLIEKNMEKIAPNTTKIAGPLTGARLISLAGGLDRLAIMPASTIQILGAEKALFRFKKEGGKPPKHGVIFQQAIINKSPFNKRGKIARVYANKISLATKADAFTKRDISNELLKDLNLRVKEIRNL